MIRIPSFIEMYRLLVKTPSVSSNNILIDNSNKDIINLLSNWFNDLNFSVDIHAIPNTNNKFNMLAKLGSGPGGLLLTGHSDTVPCDENLWTYNPFLLSEHNNKLYGLGTVDMKGFFAFLLNSLSNIKLSKLRKPIYILVTADEETSMEGARYFISNYKNYNIKPDYAIIGEPTSLKPIRAHKGHISKEIIVIGKSGHSSDPKNGINAIEIMNKVISNLIRLRGFLKKNYYNIDFAIPNTTMNFGYINGGNAANCICEYCKLHIDIRPIPGLNIHTIKSLIRNTLSPIKDCWPERIILSELHKYIPSYECPRDSAVIKIIEKLLNTKSSTVNYCTEAPFIQRLCPTIILGPGSIKQAHKPNEFIGMECIKPTQLLITKIINNFCNN